MNLDDDHHSIIPAPLTIRETTLKDLDFLTTLEAECFPVHRRSNKRSLKHSIQSDKQLIFIAESLNHEGTTSPAGAAIIFLYKRSLRVYSIAVSTQHRRKGVGDTLLQHIIQYALSHGFEKIILESDASNNQLIDWYRKHGFEITRFMQDYYLKGDSAYKMTYRPVQASLTSSPMIIVVHAHDFDEESIANINVFTATQYLTDTRFVNANNYHVLNFCSSYKPNTIGYYVSLLASARNHRITPSVMTIKDCSNLSIAQSLLDEIKDFLSQTLKTITDEKIELTIIMGSSLNPQFSEIGKKLFTLFKLPFFTITLENRSNQWRVSNIQPLTFHDVKANHPQSLNQALTDYSNIKRHNRPKLKNYKYDLAILINEDEKTPPSCPLALTKFQKAAEQVGFFVEFITSADQHRICEFDALFIRETTALYNHTYDISRYAYTEGLVVIDDPWSILLCSNKVYLHERLTNAGVPQPKGWLLTKTNVTNEFLSTLSYPLVLKLPDSSFSLGVFRVNNRNELEAKLEQLFTESDLIIAQEFMSSDFDWRIGVLDNTPLFACKYYMANGHWQIYNWQSQNISEVSGDHETIPINQTPAHILKAAMKAASLIGNGFYGIDLKECENKAYVIEVNDNPNIDVGVEDQILGDELYLRIMNSIYNRIEAERLQIRYLS